MPTVKAKSRIVVYRFDEERQCFTSFGAIENGVFKTKSNEIFWVDISGGDICIELKPSFRSKIKMVWAGKGRRKIDIFGRLWDAILVTFEGLKYQLKHRKK